MRAVAIVEDHRMTRMGIEQVLSRRSDLEVVASVSSPDDPALATVTPDVFVVSPSATADPVAMITGFAARGPVLVLASSHTASDPMPALRAGASGFVTQDADEGEFVAAVEAVARGAFYLAAGLAAALHGELERRQVTDTKGLARREVETLRLIAQGYTHGQIARRMGLTEATVNTYVKRIRAKLNVGNKAELTRRAIELGYLATSADAPSSHRPLMGLDHRTA